MTMLIFVNRHGDFITRWHNSDVACGVGERVYLTDPENNSATLYDIIGVVNQHGDRVIVIDYSPMPTPNNLTRHWQAAPIGNDKLVELMERLYPVTT